MEKKQRRTARKHTVFMIVGSVCVLSVIGGFLYFQAITHIAALMLFEIQSFQLPERIRSIPVPSALLLFSMGFLGILCVRLAEKKKTSRPPSMKNLKKAIH
ncbi:MAG: hypothetical protein GY801_03830 [bacterium]|nr:hypothetical protein [bacterium]